MTRAEGFEKLAASAFRMRFTLSKEDREYVEKTGMDVIRSHAADFVEKKLAPAFPDNDGKQTPMRGHPIFKAMHGTAMCCRGCMEKWWHVKRGTMLTAEQKQRVVDFLIAWVERQMKK